jgi:hypothetical protein
MDLPHCLIASTHGAKAAVAKMIEHRFCHDRTRCVEGAQEEHVERVDWLIATVGRRRRV